MSKSKTNATYELEADQVVWLENIAKTHGLKDASKALRVLIDFAIHEGDEQLIFEKIRCTRC